MGRVLEKEMELDSLRSRNITDHQQPMSSSDMHKMIQLLDIGLTGTIFAADLFRVLAEEKVLRASILARPYFVHRAAGVCVTKRDLRKVLQSCSDMVDDECFASAKEYLI